MKISEKKVLTFRAFFAIISLVHDEHAPIAQLDRAFDYESKGHRFESCWVHHKPLTCFAPLAVFCFALYCWKIPASRPVLDGPRGGNFVIVLKAIFR